MQYEDEHEGKKTTGHYLSQEHLRGMDEVTEYEGNVMTNRIHERYEGDGEAMMNDFAAATEAYCIGDACPRLKGAKATNQMILDSYRVPTDQAQDQDYDYE
ncbi:hypothetical protein [Paenibacillus marinisediminis]